MDFILFCLSNTDFQLVSFQLPQELTVGAAAMSFASLGSRSILQGGVGDQEWVRTSSSCLWMYQWA